MGYARYIGRVGALAVALGIGTAVASTPGVAWADELGNNSSVDGSASDGVSTADDVGDGADGDGASQTPAPSAVDDTADADGEGDELGDDVLAEGLGGEPGADGSVVDEDGEDDAAVDASDDEDNPEEPVEVETPVVVDHGSISDRAPGSDGNTDAAPAVDLAAEAAEEPDLPPVLENDGTELPAAAPTVVDPPVLQTISTTPPASGSTTPPASGSATDSVSVGSVLSALLAPVGSSNGDVPADSPLVWGLLAFARRQLGQQQRALTGDPVLLAAAAVDNTSPSGRVSVGTPGFFTAKVTGRVIGTDPDRDPLTYSGPTSTAKGSVVVDERGRFTYTPSAQARHAAARTGATAADRTDSFVVTISDGFGGLTPVTVQVQIRPANDRPDADGSVNLPNAATGAVSGSINTDDGDDDPFSYRASTTTKGSVVFNSDGTFTYTPTQAAREAAGARPGRASLRSETFTVTVDDGHGGADTVRITVPISAIDNDAPVLEGISTPTQGFFGAVSGRVSATDPDGDRLTYAGSTTTEDGRVRVTSTGRFTYTPTAEARHAAAAVNATAAQKTDTFTVTVTDRFGGSLIVPVTVNITPQNAAPSGSRATASAPNLTTGAVTIRVSGRDSDGDTLTFSAPATTAKGSLVNNGDGTFTYTPTEAARQAAGAPGAPTAAKTDALTFTLTDGYGGTSTAKVNVSIAPSTTNGAPINGNANSGQPGADGKVSGSVTATDPNGDPLNYSGSGATTKGAVVVNSNGTFVYTPTDAARHAAAANAAAAALKQDSFVVTVSDGKGGTLAVPVTVTISPKNTAPTGTANPGAPAAVTGVVTGAVISADADGDALTYSGPATSAKGGAVVVNSNGTFTYTPTAALREAAAASGATQAAKTDTFTVTINDGYLGGTTQLTVSVSIAPAANSNPSGGTVVQGSPGADGKITGTVSATDPNGDPLSYSGSTTTAKGTVVVNTNGSFTYTPTAAARHDAALIGASATVKQDSFTVVVSDGKGGTLNVAVTVDIAPANAAPAGTFTAGQANSLTGEVSGAVTSTDPDGDVRTYSGPAISVKGGTVVVNADGTFTYKASAAARAAAAAPNAPASDKVDSFSVTINDGYLGGTTTVTVSVSIAPAVAQTPNPAPINGAPLGKAIVGTTGSIFQPIFTTNSQGIAVASFVRVYDSSGALIGDTGTFNGIPGSAIKRADGGIAVVLYDPAAGTVQVHVVSAGATIATSTFTASAQPSVVGGNGVQYMVVGYRDAADKPVVNLVPLSAGAVTGYSINTIPVVGPDGSVAAFQITGSTPQNATAAILVIDANGQPRTMTAPELLTAGLSANLSLGPDGTVYFPTTVQTAGGLGTEVLIFNPTGGVSKSPILDDVTPAANIVVAANGIAYLLTKPALYASDETDTYRVSVLSGTSVTNTAEFIAPFWDPQVLGASPNGTFYVLINDSDADVNRLILVRPNGSLSTVTLGDFSFSDPYVIGADGNFYMTYEVGNVDVTAVVTSAGQKRILPFELDLSSSAQDRPQLAFADDGTAYALDYDGSGVVVRISNDGFATSTASEVIDIVGSSLQVGPDGTAYAVSVGSGAVVTAIGRDGGTVGTIFDETGVAIGPAVFADNGTAYVTVLNGSPFGSDTSTSVWAITPTGVVKLQTVSGTPASAASTGAQADPVLTVTQDGKVLLTTVVADFAAMAYITQVTILDGPTLV